MSVESQMTIQRLLDKQAITEALHLYARGVDRHDRATLERAYWPDAEDDHILFRGSGEGLLNFLLDSVEHMRTAHRITNILIEFRDERTALCESYVWAYHNMAVDGGRQDVIFGGRYLDRFEKRGETWRVAQRRLTMDYFQCLPASKDLGPFGVLNITGRHHPEDPLYEMLGARS